MFPNVLSFDIEEWFQVYNLWEAIPHNTWDKQQRRLENQMGRLLDLLDRYECKVTCFVLGWVARNEPHIVREIYRRGHEIASHGLNHDLLFDMTPEQFRRETEDTSKLLEDLTGSHVRGYRASNFSITNANLWTLEVLIELGFDYDSSIYPIRRDRYGIPGFPRGPVKLDLSSETSLIEFPMPTMCVAGRIIPAAGGGFFRFWPYMVTKRTIRALNRQQQPVVIYLHPWEFDPDQPRIKIGNRKKLWMHYYNLHSTEKRLNRILQDFKFITMGKLADKLKDDLETYRFYSG